MTEHRKLQQPTDDAKNSAAPASEEEPLSSDHVSTPLIAINPNGSNHVAQSSLVGRKIDLLKPHTVLRLQSVVGNRARQRLVGRKASDTNSIQRQEGDREGLPQRVPRVYQRQNVNIGTIEGPSLRSHGDCQWRVAYSLPQA